eukprot:maker-scaffold117_size339417-snap-gene-2.22 protein:Tk06394 transcript:maker-scaffold117_size339417-snap-gene-2.22-mRNA-1 annotation:"hypothetical protein X777_10363"
MFAFHKPKVFRSANGCCICKAKSSSSRFTDSNKYERFFQTCFVLEEERSGEICNACVLLVKRFMKLPTGSNRNWNHVVDARSGPGIKNMVRSKKKSIGNKDLNTTKDLSDKEDTPIKKKHVYKRSKKQSKELIRRREADASSDLFSNPFLDMRYWRRESICCGSIFIGAQEEVSICLEYFKPCVGCTWYKNGQIPPTLSGRTSPADEDMEVPDHSRVLPPTPDDNDALYHLAKTAESVKLKMVAEDDEGFFDKQASSPTSTDYCSTPPPSETPPPCDLEPLTIDEEAIVT